jgi:hypothetical protein
MILTQVQLGDNIGDNITATWAVMSHDCSKIPCEMVISLYALWTCFGITQLANYYQVLMALYSGLYCPSLGTPQKS